MRSTVQIFMKVKLTATAKPVGPKPAPTIKPRSPHLYDRVLLANRIKEMERQIAEVKKEDVVDIPIDLAKIVDELTARCTPGGFGQ